MRRSFAFTTLTTFAAGAIFGGLAALAMGQQPPPDRPADALHAEFARPPRGVHPMTRWWWPGGAVSDQELREQLRALHAAGFGGVEIQPFRIGLPARGKSQDDAQIDEVWSEPFAARISAVLDEASRLGMVVDLTAGSGWPFGGPWVTPELASLELRFSATTLEGPRRFFGSLPRVDRPRGVGSVMRGVFGAEPLSADWQRRLDERRRIVVVLALPGSAPAVRREPSPTPLVPEPAIIVERPGVLDLGRAVDLTARVGPEGSLDWEVPAGTWQLLVFEQTVADLWVIGGAGPGPHLVLDHLNEAALRRHLDATVGATLDRLPAERRTALRALFCDSLEVPAYLPWTDDLLSQFRTRRGYDLAPLLPLVKQPGVAEPYGGSESGAHYEARDDGELGARTRGDYWRTVSELMLERFFVPFVAYARERGLLARVQAHGAHADVLAGYALADIPETEQLYAGGQFDFLLAASSAGRAAGRALVSAESFVWFGKAYETTPETILVNTERLLAAGVNHVVYHGTPYERFDRPSPGWHPFSAPMAFSSHHNRHDTFWPLMPEVNAAIARLQLLARRGEPVRPLALLRGALAWENRPVRAPRAEEPPLQAAIAARGVGFAHLGAHELPGAVVEGGVLRTAGGARFAVLARGAGQPLDPATERELVRLAAAGGQVVVVPAGGESEAQAELLLNALGRASGFAGPTPGARLLELAFDGGTRRAWLASNERESALAATLELAGRVALEVWDPLSGEAVAPGESSRSHPRPAVVGVEYGNVGRGEPAPQPVTRVALELPPLHAVLLVESVASRSAAPESVAPRNAAAPPPGGSVRPPIAIERFTLEAAGGWDDASHPPLALAPFHLTDLSHHPELGAFAGRLVYRARFVLDEELPSRSRALLELGAVHDCAEVRANGQALPALLRRPFVADLTRALRRGENELEIVVTTSWLNRLRARGVVSPAGVGARRAAGLLGPVRVVFERGPAAAGR